jgi:hypothetical protein
MRRSNHAEEEFVNLLSMVRRRLSQARFDCISAIQEDINNKGNKVSLTKEDFGKLSVKINRLVGWGLKDVLDYIWNHEHKNDWRKSGRFYFAPGYCQYKLYGYGSEPTAERRDMSEVVSSGETPAKAIQRISENKKYEEYGFGYDWATQKEFYGFRLNIWMRHFYEKQINDIELHGFTKWFELYKQALKEDKSESKPISVKDDSAKIENPLVAICIHVSSDSLRATKKNGVLKIPVSRKDKPEGLLKRINEALECESTWANNTKPRQRLAIFAYKSKPPLEYKKEPVADIKYTEAKKHMNTIFGLICYSIFNSDAISKNASYEEVIEECKSYVTSGELSHRLHKTVETIKLLRTERKKNVWYEADMDSNYYYAIPLDDSLDVITYNVRGNMGTANLYSMYEIPSTFLFLIKTWLSEIYSQVRLCEALLDVNDESLLSIINAFNHEVGKLGVFIARRYIKPVSDLLEVEVNDDMYSSAGIAGKLSCSGEVSRWSICPVPDMLAALISLFQTWGGSKDIYRETLRIDDDQVSVDKLLELLIETACKIGAVRKLYQQATFVDAEDAISVNSKFRVYSAKMKDIIDIANGGNIAQSYYVNHGAVREIDFFIRCILAAISNSVFHAVTFVKVRFSELDNELLFSVFNDFRKDEGAKDEYTLGTEGVLKFCCSNIRGIDLECFEELDDESIAISLPDICTSNCVQKDVRVWATKIRIRLNRVNGGGQQWLEKK